MRGALRLPPARGVSVPFVSSSLGWLCWCLSFGASGLLPAVRCLFVLVVLPLCHVSLLLGGWVGIVLCCWSLLLVFLFWCPVASARPGVCLVWRLGSVFVDWCSGASARPGLPASFGGCDWCLSFGALGRDSCPPCGVRLPPLGGCGLGLVFVFRLFGASPRSGVLFFLLVVVVSALGLLPALLRFFSLLVAVMGICPSVLVLCWFRLLGPFFSSSLGHLKLAGRTCNDAWFVLSELVC